MHADWRLSRVKGLRCDKKCRRNICAPCVRGTDDDVGRGRRVTATHSNLGHCVKLNLRRVWTAAVREPAIMKRVVILRRDCLLIKAM